MTKRTALGEKQQIKTIRRPVPGREEESYLIKLRRNRVFRMRLQEYTIREICAELGASTQTICADLKAIDAALAETLDKEEASRIFNQKAAELEAMQQMAIANARGTKGMERVAFINAAARYYDMQIKLLQDAGVLPKAAARLEHSGPEGKPITIPQPTTTPQPFIINVTRTAESERAIAEIIKQRPPELR
jgi:hypothetical protein